MRALPRRRFPEHCFSTAVDRIEGDQTRSLEFRSPPLPTRRERRPYSRLLKKLNLFYNLQEDDQLDRPLVSFYYFPSSIVPVSDKYYLVEKQT